MVAPWPGFRIPVEWRRSDAGDKTPAASPQELPAGAEDGCSFCSRASVSDALIGLLWVGAFTECGSAPSRACGEAGTG